ncbi:Uncharacterised protein [Clostridioides difficile]|nr:Uncharacterised protein [Clostridioides difficile]
MSSEISPKFFTSPLGISIVIDFLNTPSNSTVIALFVAILNESLILVSFSGSNIITSFASAFFIATFNSSIVSTVYLVFSCISIILFTASSFPKPPI